jgi:hypothetical protein
MRDVDLDGVNTVCPHDKYFEDCDDSIAFFSGVSVTKESSNSWSALSCS